MMQGRQHDEPDAQSISRHRLGLPPGEIYTKTILEPSYQFMLANYYEGLLDANEAWIVMLAEQGIVSGETASKVAAGLQTMRREGVTPIATFNPRYEYFYSHLEQRLTDLVGQEAAGNINIGRTRPEPLTRMAIRARTMTVVEGLLGLIDRLLTMAGAEKSTVMPQWTHLQPAQPSTLGHYLVALSDALLRDARRLQNAFATTDHSTLGCGACSGTSYPVNRARVAELLGFSDVLENSIDSVGAGDYAAETAAALAGLNITLSRLSQDMYLWCSVEFGFAEVGDAYAGSSSMMPQKKNAYPFEYVRARAARAVTDAAGVFLALHNTTYGDTKDVEEEMVPPALRILDETVVGLELLTGTLESMIFHRESMEAAAAAGFSTATELAAVIHRTTDLDFRSAHHVVGSLVRIAVDRGVAPDKVDAALVSEAADIALGISVELTDGQVHDALDARSFVMQHAVDGGPAPSAVMENIGHARARASAVSAWLESRRDQLTRADELRTERIRALASAD